jgi:PAS domain S-box-containing protein
VSTGLVSYLNFRTSSVTLKEHIMAELHLYSESKALHINDFLEHLKGRVIDFSSDGFIRDSAKTIQKTGSREEMAALSRHLRENKMFLDPSIYGIVVVGNDGKIIGATAGEEIGIDELDDEYFLKAKGLPYGAAYVSDVLRFDEYHFGYSGAALTASAPLTDKETGERLGVIVNYIKIAELNRVVTGLKSDDEGGVAGLVSGAAEDGAAQHLKEVEVYLVNQEGWMITQSQYIKDSALRVPVSLDVVAVCSQSVSGNSYYNYRGISVIGVTLCLNNGWNLVAEMPEADIIADIAVVRSTIFLYTFIVMLLAAVFIYFFSGSIARPLVKLSLVAREIGKGNFSVRADVRTKDETGRLAAVFNEMAEKLKGLYGGMEGAIAEKTKTLTEKIAELEDTKKVMIRLLEDVAHEKEDSRRLAADLEKFKLAVDNASDHVIITDTNGIVLYANHAVTLVTGYAPKEVVGSKSSLWGKQMSKSFYETLWRTIKIDKKPFRGEVTNKKKWGEIYTADAYIAPILDAGGEVLFFIGIERDITKAKEIDKAKSELVSIASHQLRTPLTSTNWYTELLRENYGDTMTKPQKELVDEIYKSNKRMVRLVNALLNVSRIDMGTLERHPTLISACELMGAVIDDLKTEWTKKKITVKEQCNNKELKIFVDRALVLNVLQNILENAIKYAPSGIGIIIAAEQKEEWVLVSIKDEGCGIPDSQKDKIFTKMFRADNARKIDPDGNGLGLYLVKSIVEQSGGTVWFESEENKGTTFTLALPTTQEVAEAHATKGVFSHHD